MRPDKVLCTVIQAVFHTTENNTVVPRKTPTEKDKCRAEGSLSEIRMCLGWLLDTRKLLIKLISRKCKAWINDLENIIKKRSTSHDDLKSLIGKLEKVIVIIKMMVHLMNNMNALEIKYQIIHTTSDLHSVQEKMQKST